MKTVHWTVVTQHCAAHVAVAFFTVRGAGIFLKGSPLPRDQIADTGFFIESDGMLAMNAVCSVEATMRGDRTDRGAA